ncbi:hypothetical protein CFP56_018743 [Quercus suber]|uniref:Uncharacterized protein n=1 Tax=Quercus suber TaxID=58331 RepID=A0AAW0KL53_QUESU
MDQFGAASQQECYHPLFPFPSTKTSKKKEILPSSRSVRFVSATPYTQDSVAPQFRNKQLSSKNFSGIFYSNINSTVCN